ncbi:ABC transporter permease [Aciduricibacillus chroicocephali]|uniref:ABC transporter permease n=1 Tax=Aciduricibacillus chroicocephali TaxID=3054939 RepID=A0ABY9KUX7_9BACI|nr:ABC transporter permease [Bacillaceae bacterium 44XB]
MKQVAWLMLKTFKSVFAKPKNIITYLLLPLTGILIAFIAYGQTNEETINVGVVDLDHQQVAKSTIQYLKHLDSFKVKNVKSEEIKQMLAAEEIDVAVTMGEGFSASVLAGAPAQVNVQSIKGESVTAFMKQYLYSYIDQMSKLGQAAKGNQAMFGKLLADYEETDFPVKADIENNSRKSFATTYTAIGFLLMVMLLSAANLSEIIMKEKADWTYYRLLSTPISAKDYMLSNVLMNLVVMLIQGLLTLTVLWLLFKIDIGIPFLDIAAVLAVFSLVSVGLSLVIVAFAGSRSSAGALINLIIIPTTLLSGSFWPVEIMPQIAQRLADFLPQRWALKTLTAMYDGSNTADLYMNFLILFAFALTFFMIAAYKFNRNNNTKQFS